MNLKNKKRESFGASLLSLYFLAPLGTQLVSRNAEGFYVNAAHEVRAYLIILY